MRRALAAALLLLIGCPKAPTEDDVHIPAPTAEDPAPTSRPAPRVSSPPDRDGPRRTPEPDPEPEVAPPTEQPPPPPTVTDEPEPTLRMVNPVWVEPTQAEVEELAAIMLDDSGQAERVLRAPPSLRDPMLRTYREDAERVLRFQAHLDPRMRALANELADGGRDVRVVGALVYEVGEAVTTGPHVRAALRNGQAHEQIADTIMRQIEIEVRRRLR